MGLLENESGFWRWSSLSSSKSKDPESHIAGGAGLNPYGSSPDIHETISAVLRHPFGVLLVTRAILPSILPNTQQEWKVEKRDFANQILGDWQQFGMPYGSKEKNPALPDAGPSCW